MSESESTQAVSNYSRPIIDSNIIRIRLDTQKLIDDIKNYLRGDREEYIAMEDGTYRTAIVQSGKPKMTEEGINEILSMITTTINAQAVQGNFWVDRTTGYSEAYENYIYEYNIALIMSMSYAGNKWVTDDNEIEKICNQIMLLVQPFFSRLIGNKERDSYSETMRAIESNTLAQKGGLNLFKK